MCVTLMWIEKTDTLYDGKWEHTESNILEKRICELGISKNRSNSLFYDTVYDDDISSSNRFVMSPCSGSRGLVSVLSILQWAPNSVAENPTVAYPTQRTHSTFHLALWLPVCFVGIILFFLCLCFVGFNFVFFYCVRMIQNRWYPSANPGHPFLADVNFILYH